MRIKFQHLLSNPNTGTDVDRGWRVGWQSRVETNTAADRKGNTSGTFWDWGGGKTVPVVQSPPNLHQVSGIKESISALAFHVWLNHPGQCVRCWTKRILSKKEEDDGEEEEEDLGLSTVRRGRFLMTRVKYPFLIKIPFCWSYFIIFYQDSHQCLTFKY